MSYQKNATSFKTLFPELNEPQIKILARLLEEQVIGKDGAIEESKVVWYGDGSVTADNADDLRTGWNNNLKTEQRAALRKFLGLE